MRAFSFALLESFVPLTSTLVPQPMVCNTCRAALVPGDTVCRNCGALVPVGLAPQQHPDARLHLTLAIIVPLIFFSGIGIYAWRIASKRAAVRQGRDEAIKARTIQLAGNSLAVEKLGAPLREVCCTRFE